MILFTPPDLDALKRKNPGFVDAILAQREAYATGGRPPYTPPGSDLAHGILSRSPLAAQIFERSTTRYFFPSTNHSFRLNDATLISCIALQAVLDVTFQAQQMTALLAVPNGTHPISLTLTFKSRAIDALHRHLKGLKGAPANFCFGGDAITNHNAPLLNCFPSWRPDGLTLSPFPATLQNLPCLKLLHLLLCCEVGYCPARLFQLIDLPSVEALDLLAERPRAEAEALRAQIERTLPAPFTPPPPHAASIGTTYADLQFLLKKYRISRKDLALATHLSLDSLARNDSAPLPTSILEIFNYAQGHSHATLRQELLRRAGPEHACTLWSANDLRTFRDRYHITQTRLKQLIPCETLYLTRWENETGDIPLSICKALDELQHAFRRVFPEVENPAFKDAPWCNPYSPHPRTNP